MIAWLPFADQLNIAAGWCIYGKSINLNLMEARKKTRCDKMPHSQYSKQEKKMRWSQ